MIYNETTALENLSDNTDQTQVTTENLENSLSNEFSQNEQKITTDKKYCPKKYQALYCRIF